MGSKYLDVSILVELRFTFLVSLYHVLGIAMVSSNNVYSTDLLNRIKNYLNQTKNISRLSQFIPDDA